MVRIIGFVFWLHFGRRENTKGKEENADYHGSFDSSLTNYQTTKF